MSQVARWLVFKWRRIRVHLNLFYYYASLVEHEHLTYRPNQSRIPIDRPLWLLLTNLAILPYGLACILPLVTNRLNHLIIFDVFTKMFPPESKRQFYIMANGWTWARLCLYLTSITGDLRDYRFLVAVVVNDHGGSITPRDVGLTKAQYELLRKFRNRTFTLLQVSVWFAPFIGIASTLTEMIRVGAWRSHPSLCLFWSATLFAWVVSAGSIVYGLAAFTLVTVQYLWLKQKRLCHHMDRSLHRLASFVHRYQCIHEKQLSHRFKGCVLTQFIEYSEQNCFLQGEMSAFNGTIKRVLTIMLGCYIFVITYSGYHFLVANNPLRLQQLAVMLFISHLLAASLVVFGCARIANASQSVGQRSLRFWNLSHQSSLFPVKQLIKVFYYISTLFFLVCGQRSSSRLYYG